jgi:hypothetical protein
MDPRRPFWRRPLVVALLVLIAGAAMGAAGFAAEQRYVVWHPKITRVSGGWRVAAGQGNHQSGVIMAGDHLAWTQGVYTCVLDLRSGDVSVVGFANGGTSIWPPAIEQRYVAWTESPRDTRGASTVWVYDVERGRRVAYMASANAAMSGLAHDLLVWYDGSGPSIVGVTLASGARSVVASSPTLDLPPLASGSLVGWLEAPAGGGVDAVVKDLATGTVTRVILGGSGSGLSIGDVQLAGGLLVWTQQGERSTSIMSYRVATQTTTVVARGDVGSPATDGSTVVWWTSAVSGVGATIMGARTDGGRPFVVTHLSGWPNGGLAVAGRWVAWTNAGNGNEYLQTGRLPR